MPLNHLRRLSGHERTPQANRQLGIALAFVAGAVNAGGFIAVQRYTSHMTGVVSAMSDDIALGRFSLLWTGIAAFVSFVAGAMTTGVLVNFGRRRDLRSEYALPLLIEAMLLLAFGALGAWLATTNPLFLPLTFVVLSYMMGLQNALVTKISSGNIRTTHVTGITTDLGIELGKLMYWNRHDIPGKPAVVADRDRIGVLSMLLLAFFGGGIIGAVAFSRIGYISTVPLATLLIILASVPTADDIGTWLHKLRNR